MFTLKVLVGAYLMSLRLWAIPVMFVLYILYQGFVKKKPFDLLKNDIGVLVFFTTVYLGLYYFLFKG